MLEIIICDNCRQSFLMHDLTEVSLTIAKTGEWLKTDTWCKACIEQYKPSDRLNEFWSESDYPQNSK